MHRNRLTIDRAGRRSEIAIHFGAVLNSVNADNFIGLIDPVENTPVTNPQSSGPESDCCSDSFLALQRLLIPFDFVVSNDSHHLRSWLRFGS